ncbi:Transcription factor DIVARICATA [Hibiscus syriacus]|uniref:Transcription factor DIVARICATA n=1 Tax=Hibiscus syriacus TaxID=106335 RepID=A0A6A3A8C9_HIBSY|nr:Transcription factor DIVARICATA [Hibiscus syriacus]
MGNLLPAHYHSSSSAAASPCPGSPSSDHFRDSNHDPEGYLSDEPTAHSSANPRGERKKGVPWTEEEHRLFLIGLQKLGKGNWRGIARNFVVSRTPTQVASHAQKYFIRQSTVTRRKRRSSLFDMVPSDMATDTPVLLPSYVEDADNSNSTPSLHLSLDTETAAQEAVKVTEETMMASSGLAPMVNRLVSPYAFWPPDHEGKGIEASKHQVLKPIPLFPKEPVNVDQLIGMSHLSIGETVNGHIELSPLSLQQLGEPSRQSAFHANAADLRKGKTGAIQAV